MVPFQFTPLLPPKRTDSWADIAFICAKNNNFHKEMSNLVKEVWPLYSIRGHVEFKLIIIINI